MTPDEKRTLYLLCLEVAKRSYAEMTEKHRREGLWAEDEADPPVEDLAAHYTEMVEDGFLFVELREDGQAFRLAVTAKGARLAGDAIQ